LQLPPPLIIVVIRYTPGNGLHMGTYINIWDADITIQSIIVRIINHIDMIIDIQGIIDIMIPTISSDLILTLDESKSNCIRRI
jgi:hypothetical protein